VGGLPKGGNDDLGRKMKDVIREISSVMKVPLSGEGLAGEQGEEERRRLGLHRISLENRGEGKEKQAWFGTALPLRGGSRKNMDLCVQRKGKKTVEIHLFWGRKADPGGKKGPDTHPSESNRPIATLA